MNKILIFGIFLVLLFSCKTDKNQTITENQSSFEMVTSNWPMKTPPNSKTQEIIKNWAAFGSLQSSFDAIYNVANTEDLSLVLEDLIEKQKALEKSGYPKNFSKAQIKSRQKVFHTYILKAKGDLIYRIDSGESVVQMINAYNSMVEEMNSITNNTLDLKTLLEEDI